MTEIKDKVYYVGVNDRKKTLFEGLWPLPSGVSYNSYLIDDDKICLIDTVEVDFFTQFLENIREVIGDRPIDYIVINHMEPDHSGSLSLMRKYYPDIQVVSNKKAFDMLRGFYGISGGEYEVKNGDTLELGHHILQFFLTPMVHWPEVMFSYDTTDSILFSADAFGVFGCNNGNIFADEQKYKDKDFLDDARRYYANIVGKYGQQTQAALKKVSSLSISMICPLHGPIWREDISFIVNKYDLWSRYVPEEQAVLILYNSVYGHTESIIHHFALELGAKGVKNIRIYDVSKTEVSYLIGEVFRASHLVFGATTYNNGLFPRMESLLTDMKNLNVQNRKVALIENGTWAPQSAKLLRAVLDSMKDITYIGEPLTVKSATVNREALEALADAVAKDLQP